MENSISRQNVDVNVRAVVTDPNITVQYKTKILQKNVVGGVNTLVPAMISEANVKYVIKYDFDLGGETITIPANCVLEFDGGSLNDGSIVGDNTSIVSKEIAIFNNISINGTWIVEKIYSTWFVDINADNKLKQLINLSNDNIYNEIIIREGTYIVSAINAESGILNFKSNTKIILDGTISLSPNGLKKVWIVYFKDVENITITGTGKIEGDKYTHTISTGEYGHGIAVRDSSKILIEGIEITKCWGDCIYIGGDTVGNNQITIKNCNLYDSRRQGISVVWVKHLLIENCYIHDIKGTLPEACIDIEPNGDEFINTVEGVIIRNNIMDNSNTETIAFGIVPSKLVSNVLVENNIISGSKYLSINASQYSKNLIFVNNIFNFNGNSVSDFFNIQGLCNTINTQKQLRFAGCIWRKTDINYTPYPNSGDTTFIIKYGQFHDLSIKTGENINIDINNADINTLNADISSIRTRSLVILHNSKIKNLAVIISDYTTSPSTILNLEDSIVDKFDFTWRDKNVESIKPHFIITTSSSNTKSVVKNPYMPDRSESVPYCDLDGVVEIIDIQNALNNKITFAENRGPSFVGLHYNKTLQKMILWNGTAWVDATGTPV